MVREGERMARRSVADQEIAMMMRWEEEVGNQVLSILRDPVEDVHYSILEAVRVYVDVLGRGADHSPSLLLVQVSGE